jgi:hypothetical protein
MQFEEQLLPRAFTLWGNRSSAPLRITVLAAAGGIPDLIANANPADVPACEKDFTHGTSGQRHFDQRLIKSNAEEGD